MFRALRPRSNRAGQTEVRIRRNRHEFDQFGLYIYSNRHRSEFWNESVSGSQEIHICGGLIGYVTIRKNSTVRMFSAQPWRVLLACVTLERQESVAGSGLRALRTVCEERCRKFRRDRCLGSDSAVSIPRLSIHRPGMKWNVMTDSSTDESSGRMGRFTDQLGDFS